MKKLLLVLPLALLALSCSDEDREKWSEMNKDRIEAAPNEDPNLPTTKADMDAVKQIGSKNDGPG